MSPILYLVHRVPFPPDKGDRIRAFHILQFLAKQGPVHLATLTDDQYLTQVTDEARAGLSRYCEKLAIVPLPRTRRLRMIGSPALGRTTSVGAFDSPALRAMLRSWCRDTRYRVCLISASSMDSHLFRRHRAREKEVRNSLGLDPYEIVIGAVGRLSPEKRFDVLLHAFAQIHSRRPVSRLLIVGEGGERTNLEETIGRLGLADSCRFLGHRADIVDLHHAFDLLVQSSDHEGTSNAVLEATAGILANSLAVFEWESGLRRTMNRP